MLVSSISYKSAFVIFDNDNIQKIITLRSFYSSILSTSLLILALNIRNSYHRRFSTISPEKSWQKIIPYDIQKRSSIILRSIIFFALQYFLFDSSHICIVIRTFSFLRINVQKFKNIVIETSYLIRQASKQSVLERENCTHLSVHRVAFTWSRIDRCRSQAAKFRVDWLVRVWSTA